jgi:hypothetical protein
VLNVNVNVNEPIMIRLTLEIELPDVLAEQARKAGLLEPEALERLVREALRATRVKDLAEAREVLAANPLPPMTPEEVQTEIGAYAPKPGVRLVLDTNAVFGPDHPASNRRPRRRDAGVRRFRKRPIRWLPRAHILVKLAKYERIPIVAPAEAVERLGL